MDATAVGLEEVWSGIGRDETGTCRHTGKVPIYRKQDGFWIVYFGNTYKCTDGVKGDWILNGLYRWAEQVAVHTLQC